jgi:DNA-binding SARP family transcriptional activator
VIGSRQRTAVLPANTREPQGINLVNARWKRQPGTDREARERFGATIEQLSAGEYASVPELIVALHGTTAAGGGGPVVAELVEETRRLAAAWSELCSKASPEDGDAMSSAPAHRRAVPRSSAKANSSTAVVHTLKVLPRRLASPAANETSRMSNAAPELAACVLGPFHARLNGQVIEDWPNCRSKAIFKYLLLNRKHPVAREALMERFWPEAEPEAARNSLNVAMHRLRRALGRDGFPFVMFADGHYRLNPKLAVSIDAEAFLAHAAHASELEGDQDVDGAIREYTACVALYQGELLAEDRHGYDEWLLPLRQQLRDRYLHALDRLGRIQLERQDLPACTTTCAKMLAVDACNESAHRMLMRCYARLGQPQLAQQQYQTCIQALNRELGIPASPETTELYRQIVRRDAV